MQFAEQIKEKALGLGFDLVGITDVSPLADEHLTHLTDWLNRGYAGQMTWMLKDIEKRINPATLLESARSVIVVGLNYKPPVMNLTAKTANFGIVTTYARYEDYHIFIKKQLRKLVNFLKMVSDRGLKFKICVDSSPLLERALAERAGLGFIARNHMLTHPAFGQQLFLGEIITNLNLEQSANRNPQPELNTCHFCDKCIAACPTGALRSDGHFDATKCINYLTIESDADIPPELVPKIGNNLFGCSQCLLVCPHNLKAPPCTNKQFLYYPDREKLNLVEILNLTEDQFHTKFANSPILRPGLARLKYIAQICLNNLKSLNLD